jgi:DNA-binding transcriptional ArsR family regulator
LVFLSPATIEEHIVDWQYGEMAIELEAGLKALANDRRLQILEWLKDPTAHFRPQVDGDLVKDGVCGLLITEKLGVSQPTASEHLRVLTDAGFLTGKRIKQWIFYQRDEKEIVAFKALLKKQI